MNHDNLKNEYEKYRTLAHKWSLIHQTSLYASAILSASAAFVLQLNVLKDHYPNARIDISAALAFLAAIITTITASGNFQRRYRANRIAKSGILILLNKISNPNADIDAIDKDYERIIRERTDELLGK